MNLKERKLLVEWIQQEYNFLEELKGRINLHEKVLLELDIKHLRLRKPDIKNLE